MPLIVGLGNPGEKYKGTRHNVGFELIDRMINRFSAVWSPGKGSFLMAKARYQKQQLIFIKPTTYMNDSGQAVQQALHWFKIEQKHCLVCFDDLNLDLGTIRLRRGGSAGGHNGIKDIIQKTGTNRFPRLRIGIGNNFRDGQQINYVLSRFNRHQQKIIDQTLEQAEQAALQFAEQGIETAMNTFN